MAGIGGLILLTAPAVLLFVVIFLVGEHIHPLRRFVRDRRSLMSFSAGLSAAYVFVHMMPELHEAREVLVEAAGESLELRYEGMAVYLVALAGFLCFYGLEQARAKAAELAEAGGEAGHGESMHLGGMACYVGLMSYLLVRSAGTSVSATVLFAVAFGGHFLALEHSLREEYGQAYRRSGRWLMAGACVIGWSLGVFLPIPAFVLALLVAFISGGVIMTNTLMELAEGKDGRFLPFLVGSVLYAALLVPLG